MKSNEIGVVYVKRFNGNETYRIDSAIWQLLGYQPSFQAMVREEYAKKNEILNFLVRPENHQKRLFFRFSCQPLQQQDDTENRINDWSVEISYLSENLSYLKLVQGFKLIQTLDNENDFETNMYFGDHQEATANKIEILDRQDTTLKVKLKFATEDFNGYYDPKQEVELIAYFKHSSNSTIDSSWMGEDEIALFPGDIS